MNGKNVAAAVRAALAAGAESASEVTAGARLTPYEMGVADRLVLLVRAGRIVVDVADLMDIEGFASVLEIACEALAPCSCGRASVGDVEALPRGWRLYHDADGCAGRARTLERWQPPDDASPPRKPAA